MSTKFQVTLPDGLAHELKHEAARRRIPLAEFIRRTMEARLREDWKTNPADPFAGVTGIVDAAETDLAAGAGESLYRWRRPRGTGAGGAGRGVKTSPLARMIPNRQSGARIAGSPFPAAILQNRPSTRPSVLDGALLQMAIASFAKHNNRDNLIVHAIRRFVYHIGRSPPGPSPIGGVRWSRFRLGYSPCSQQFWAILSGAVRVRFEDWRADTRGS